MNGWMDGWMDGWRCAMESGMGEVGWKMWDGLVERDGSVRACVRASELLGFFLVYVMIPLDWTRERERGEGERLG